LISGLHTYFSKKETYYKNLLPPLSILNTRDESDLINNLEKLNFSLKNNKAA
jgi:4-hydroxy-tetrahydrodipicolinate synthase